MTVHAPVTAAPPVPRKRGPKTPEGKARSAMDAVRHGLRARSFAILPEEDQADWALHLLNLRAGYRPVDPTEEKLVTAIAVAMWHELRADRTLAETMAAVPPCAPGRSHGTDLAEPAHARSLTTAIRYMTAAGMATQRAQRAFLAHQKARQAGLILPASEPVECPADENDTNELHDRAVGMPPAPPFPGDPSSDCTHDFPATLPVVAGAAAANGKYMNEFLPGATGRVPEPANRHQRRRLEALALRACAA